MCDDVMGNYYMISTEMYILLEILPFQIRLYRFPIHCPHALSWLYIFGIIHFSLLDFINFSYILSSLPTL